MVFGDKDGFVRYIAALQDVKSAHMQFNSASGGSRGDYYIQEHTHTHSGYGLGLARHPRLYNSNENSKNSEEAARMASHLSFQGANNDSAYRTFYSESKSRMGTPLNGVASDVGGKMRGEDLEEALDDIYERRILFLGRFELYSQVCLLDRALSFISVQSLCHVASLHAWLQ